MEPELWKAIQLLFKEMNRSFETLNTDGNIDTEQISENSSEHMDFLKARSSIRKKFDQLRVKLLSYLSEQECYQVLFPLVIYFDERVQAKFFKEKKINWPLLQKELYEVDNGGELFYDTLDSILKKPQTSQFIYEVNYFCLKHGFLGKYVDDPVRIHNYMDLLKKKISVNSIEETNIFTDETGELRYFTSPLLYYNGAALLVISFYGFLRFIG